jgi:hypothetical protein
MGKLALTTSAAAFALLAAACLSPAKAADSDFKGYTKMPSNSGPHKYTPSHSKAKNPNSDFKGYTSMPPGSAQNAEAPPAAQSPNPTAVTPQPRSNKDRM